MVNQATMHSVMLCCLDTPERPHYISKITGKIAVKLWIKCTQCHAQKWQFNPWRPDAFQSSFFVINVHWSGRTSNKWGGKRHRRRKWSISFLVYVLSEEPLLEWLGLHVWIPHPLCSTSAAAIYFYNCCTVAQRKLLKSSADLKMS